MSSDKHKESELASTTWTVHASCAAINTSNPIREIIETMNLAENPDKKLIPLSIGDPTIFGNLKPCQEILDALQRANTSGKFYGYQMAAGMEASRKAVAEYHYRCTGNIVEQKDVILASGCSHAIDLCICVLARHGQNILIPRPGFPLYKTLTSVYGVQYKQYNLLADKNWSIDLKHLESLIDENTAAIVVNNPSNPCGSVFSRKHLLQILELAERYRKPIIADEIYDKFVFSSELYTRYRVSCGQSKRSLLSSSLSSSFSESKKEDAENRQPSSLMSSDADSSGTDEGQLLDDAYEEFVDLTHEEDVEVEEGEEGEKATTLEANSSLEEVTSSDDDDDDDEYDDYDYDEDINSDDYDELVPYVPFRSLSSLSETVPILTCGGISKTCLIPGLRLGWIIINDRKNIFDVSVRNGLNRLTQRLMGPNSLVQGALPDILANVPELFYSQTMDFIFNNAKLCYERLRLVKGLRPYMPQGSMYFMVKFDEKSFPTIDGDLDFTSKLMNEESVLVLPGRCFDFPNYFRICLTVPSNIMEEALDRMREFCERHYVCKSNTPITTLDTTNYKTTQDQLVNSTTESSKPACIMKKGPQPTIYNQIQNTKTATKTLANNTSPAVVTAAATSETSLMKLNLNSVIVHKSLTTSKCKW